MCVEEVRDCLLFKLLGTILCLCHWVQMVGRMCCLDQVKQRFIPMAMLLLNDLMFVGASCGECGLQCSMDEQ